MTDARTLVTDAVVLDGKVLLAERAGNVSATFRCEPVDDGDTPEQLEDAAAVETSPSGDLSERRPTIVIYRSIYPSLPAS